MRSYQQQQGFSLVELMVTVVIMAIFAAIALPSMSSMTSGAKLNESVYGFVNVINAARQEAVRQGVPVYLCGATLKSDGKSNGCQSGKSGNVSKLYAKGLTSFADYDRDGELDSGEAQRTFYVDKKVDVLVQQLDSLDAPLTKLDISKDILGYQGSGDSIGEVKARRYVFAEKGQPANKCRTMYIDFGGRAVACKGNDYQRKDYIGKLCSCPKSMEEK